ncbi:MAG: TIM barrel protein [Acidobacteria bacterium]|nr:TIM barrel protein [Acidobacteriota bacterium]
MLRRTFVASAAAASAAPQAPARPKASVMLWTLKGTFEQKLEIASKAGCESVELVGEHLEWSDADVKAKMATAKSLKLGMDTISAMPNWGKEPVSMLDPAQRPSMLKEVARQIEWAKRLEIPQLLLMSGNAIAGRSFDEQFASMLEGCKRAGEMAAKAGVTMIIEPLNNKVDHKGFFMSNCVDGLRMVKETNSPHVKLLFDIYHEQIQLGNVTRTVVEAAPHVRVFHIADNPGRHEPGTGEMNYANIYAAIKKTGYAHYMTMEYLPTGDQGASLEKAVKEMRAVL